MKKLVILLVLIVFVLCGCELEDYEVEVFDYETPEIEDRYESDIELDEGYDD